MYAISPAAYARSGAIFSRMGFELFPTRIYQRDRISPLWGFGALASRLVFSGSFAHHTRAACSSEAIRLPVVVFSRGCINPSRAGGVVLIRMTSRFGCLGASPSPFPSFGDRVADVDTIAYQSNRTSKILTDFKTILKYAKETWDVLNFGNFKNVLKDSANL